MRITQQLYERVPIAPRRIPRALTGYLFWSVALLLVINNGAMATSYSGWSDAGPDPSNSNYTFMGSVSSSSAPIPSICVQSNHYRDGSFLDYKGRCLSNDDMVVANDSHTKQTGSLYETKGDHMFYESGKWTILHSSASYRA